MKKILILTAGILMLSALTAGAQDMSITLDVAETQYDTITITPQFDEGNACWVTMTVTDGNGNPMYFGEKRPNETDLNFVVNMDSDTVRTRNYKAVMTVSKTDGTSETTDKEFTYYSFAEIKDAIDKVLKGDMTLKAAKDILSLDITGLYSNIDNDSLIVSSMKDILGDKTDISAIEFREAYDKALVKAAIKSKNTATITALIDKYAELVGITDNLKESEWFKEGNKAKIISAIALKAYEDENEFLQSFRTNVFLDRLSGLHSSKIISFLRENNNSYYDDESLIELNFDSFDLKLKTDGKRDYAASLISKADTSTPEKLIKEFNAAITAAQNYNPGVQQGGGSSGGGGYSYTAPTETKDEKTIFDDINGVAWAKKEIEYLAEKGILNGKSDRHFNPNDNITREEFVAIIVRAFGFKASGNVEYSDVPNNAWYYESVNAAYENGIASGFDGKFGTGEKITRQDMAVMLYRTANKLNIELEAKSEREISDKADISDYAYEAVDAMYKAEIINGMGGGKFEPMSNATRAQAAKLIYDILNR